MNTQLRSLYWFACAVLALASAGLGAQEPADLRKVVLPSLDSQVGARLTALDRELASAFGAEHAAGLTAQAASSPLAAFTRVSVDPPLRQTWDGLADRYLRLMQESPEALVTLPNGQPGVSWSSVQVRRLCQHRLSQMPRVTLDSYRRRVDGEAQSLLHQGRQTRSAAPLRRLVREMFCCTPCDQALDLLGDLAFEQGDFLEAHSWWSLLAPLEPSSDDATAVLWPHADLARVRAKQILAMLFHGRYDDAQAEIVRFRERHPRAKGTLAGQDGDLAAILHGTLQTLAKERIVNNDEPWTTFGGDVTRSRCLSQSVSWRLWEDGPAWRVPLTPANNSDSPRIAPLARRLAFHPVIANGQVLIADHRAVFSYDLLTGKELFRYEPELLGLADLPAEIDATVDLPRFTLSVDGDRAYVRLGRLGMAPKKPAASYLICLDLTQPAVNKKRELWHIRAKADDGALAFFEGAPLVKDGRVYAAVSKIAGQHVASAIVCYDRNGRPLWTRDVCECPEFENGSKPRHRQHLLTWGAGQVVYCSHAGAVVAVNAWTGESTWGVRYPSRGPTLDHEPSPRDLAPAVYADGRFFAAPLDSDRIFGIDAATGKVVWELEEIEVVHLLGVSHGRLLATTRTGIASIRTTSGAVEWIQPSDGHLASAGRGLIAGGWFYWPTQDGLLPYRALALRTGRQQDDRVLPEPAIFDPTMMHTLPVGNWAFGQGALAIAGTKDLVVYTTTPAHRQAPLPATRPQARLVPSGKRGAFVNNP